MLLVFLAPTTFGAEYCLTHATTHPKLIRPTCSAVSLRQLSYTCCILYVLLARDNRRTEHLPLSRPTSLALTGRQVDRSLRISRWLWITDHLIMTAPLTIFRAPTALLARLDNRLDVVGLSRLSCKHSLLT